MTISQPNPPTPKATTKTRPQTPKATPKTMVNNIIALSDLKPRMMMIKNVLGLVTKRKSS